LGDNSLGSHVFQTLREDILAGKYRKGEELREKTLGDDLGVSRTPVREALRQLNLEGLVSIVPNKGAVVKGISGKDIQDIYDIRYYLEGLCARWAACHITAKQLEELEENIYLTDFHAAKQHFDCVFELDSRFHETLYRASGSSVIQHVLTDYHHYVQRVRRVTLADPVRAADSNEEHKQILMALRDKDSGRAEELARVHICNTIANMDKFGWENLVK